VEGALRKWVAFYGEGIPRYLAYFSKDMVFGLLVLLPVRTLPSVALVEFGRWLWPGCILFTLGAGVSCLHGFNLVGSVLTLRASVVLPMVAYFAIRRLGGVPVRHVAWLLAILTLLNFGLAILQNRLPADHFLNQYATDMGFVVVTETGVRATGTFAYITGIAIMSSVGIWAGMALLSLARQKWDQIAGYMALIAGFGCALASISRSPVVIDLMMLMVWLVASRAAHRQIIRSLLAAVAVGLVVWAGGFGETLFELGEGVAERNEMAGDTFTSRGLGQFAEALAALVQAPMGLGLGTEQVGGNYASVGQMSFTNYESQLPRLVLESGILGLVGFLVICAGALWALQRARTIAPTDGEKALMLATQLLLIPMFYINVIFNHTASAFVWMIFAVVMASVKPGRATLSNRERRKRWQARRGQTHRPGFTPAPGTVSGLFHTSIK